MKFKDVQDRAQTYQKIFSDDNGAKVIQDLLDSTAHHCEFIQDPNQLYFFNGRRSLVMDILKLLKFDSKKMNELYRNQYGDTEESDE
jgi:hypothetical protein